ncbi:hypothetical protein PDJAM_G00203550 [Pangasius djambal]|uniref:Uncharacterized protein n=1 Tax=Pangasius djambal TaxID=1691987 RepID=A0ACC5Y837_9TELE|nr:hypothetical protein [Pangasius djambal]
MESRNNTLATCSTGQFQGVLQNHLSHTKEVRDFSASYTDGSDQEFYGSCDFEKDACGWKDISKDAFRWRLEKANISSVPGVDHTTGTPWGQVMHVEGENPGVFSKAILEFSFSQHTALGCQISFWYHLHDPAGISSHFDLSLDNNGSSVVLWDIKQGQTNGWVNTTVRIGNRPKGSKLLFSVVPTHIGCQDIMMDDITLMGCAEGDIPAGSEQLSCDFERNTCGWYIDQSASLTWERKKPSYDNQGPGHDQTTGSALATCSTGQFQGVLQNHLSHTKEVCDFSASYTDGSDQEFYGSCDFEKDACGWKDISKDAFRWRLEKANISSVPGVDHTTGTPWGQVMHVEGENPGVFSKAILEFSFSQHTALGCQISFWYHLHDPAGISSHFDLSLDNNGSSVVLWDIKQGQTNGWVNTTVRIGNRPKGSKLLFSVVPTHIGRQDIMMDDITLMGCAEGDIPAGSEQLSCDFERNTCGWYIDQSASLTWERKKPSYDNQGPGHDQTTGSGYYMLIATKKNSNPSQTARLISYPQQAKCVSFWYHIYGASIGSLRFISKNTNGTETVMWTRTGTQGNKWRFADLSFATNDSPVQFIFEAILGGTDGSIALDEVQVWSSVNGSCPPERECTFQSSLCGLEPDPAADFPWVRITGMQAAGSASPSKDHTLGTDQGYYLSAQLWDRPSGSQSRMVTRFYEPNLESEECWMFWYHMNGRDVGMLNVYLHESHNSWVALWSRSGDQGERWRPGRATVLTPLSPYQGSPQRFITLHLSLSSASSTLAPTSFISSFITSIYLLFGFPLRLLPGSSMSNILLPIYSLSLL